MNALDVEMAIKRHCHGAILIPEAPVRYSLGIQHSAWGGPSYEGFSDYFADFLMITDAGYGTEIEVKVSRADWKADLEKPKWSENRFPAWISRFIYAVPEALGIPDFVPPAAGVWHIRGDGTDGWHRIVIARAPKRIGNEKVPQETIDRWMRSLYFRFWTLRAERQQRLPERARAIPMPSVSPVDVLGSL